MAGFGRNTRAGKRPLSSSSSASSYYTSYAYCISVLIFVALCIAGMWLLASFSLAPSNAASASHIQSSLARSLSLSSFYQSDPPPSTDDGPGELTEAENVENGENGSESNGEIEREGGESNREELREDGEKESEKEESQQEQKKEDQGENNSSANDNQESEESESKQEEPEINKDEKDEQKDEQKEESKLDGGMEEEQRRHEESQREHDEQLPSNNEINNGENQQIEERESEKIEQVIDHQINENGEAAHTEERKEMDNESYGEKRPWATQADQSEREKERREEQEEQEQQQNQEQENVNRDSQEEYEWKLCNGTGGPDYIPCLDNLKAIKKLRPENYRRYEHRERHCPKESPICLVPLPKGYRRPIEWPKSRDKIWYHNVPHTKLAEVKGHQNWVKVTGQYLTFPGGGTQFIHGALHYIDFLQQSVRGIAWGKRTRVVLDVGCGVASFGGYLFEREVLTMSFAPKDEHEAQVQLALERGIPAISAVMGSQRLQFPSKVFDLVHCARCRVPWHVDGGRLLLELNRVLRPGGFFVWSATPVYQKLEEDVEIWKAMKSLTQSMCWDLVTIKKDRLNGIGAAFFRKSISNDCYNSRSNQNPPMCNQDDDPNAAWYIPLKTCMHEVPTDESERGTNWPQEWPRRLTEPPYWLNRSQTGVYGKPAPDDFVRDYDHWNRVVKNSYLSGLGIDWSTVRNVMDMRAVYGGFAAVLKELKVWVMNVVNIDAPDTLPIIYERGLFGIYHDWCESFSTYPRSYDLLHADHLFSRLKDRCPILPVIVEVDRIVRPGGKIIVRDESSVVNEIESLLKSLHWEVHLSLYKDHEAMLFAKKSDWRPEVFADPSY